VSLKYEPASEPLYIYVEQFCFRSAASPTGPTPARELHIDIHSNPAVGIDKGLSLQVVKQAALKAIVDTEREATAQKARPWARNPEPGNRKLETGTRSSQPTMGLEREAFSAVPSSAVASCFLGRCLEWKAAQKARPHL